MLDETMYTLGSKELDQVGGGFACGCIPGFPPLPPLPEWPRAPVPIPVPLPPRPGPFPPFPPPWLPLRIPMI